MGAAERLGMGNSRVFADDALQLLSIFGQTLVDTVDLIVVFVVNHPNWGRIVLVFNKKECAGIHIGDLVHQVHSFLIFQIVIELVVQSDGLAFLC